MNKYAVLIPFLAVLFACTQLLQAQEWTICGYVSNPGQQPSICVVNDNVVWIAGGPLDTPKVYRTLNGGSNWEQISTTGISHQLYCIWAISPYTAFVGEGANLNGGAKMYKTESGGLLWNTVLQTSSNGGFFNGIMFSKNSSHRGFGISVAERIYKTLDNGMGWNMEQSGVVGVSNAHNSLTVIDENFYGFGMNNGAARIRKTTDGGLTWQNHTVNLTGNYTSAIAFYDNKLIGITATSTSMPYISRTTDGGITWAQINIGAGVTGNCFLKWINETSVVYILGYNGGIKRSLDYGMTWTQMATAGVTDVYHFDFEKVNDIIYGYAVSRSGTVIKLVDSVLIVLGNINQNNVPDKYSLGQNYPNPFNPVTNIKYTVPDNNIHVRLTVFDLLGREVAVPVDKIQNAGNYEITFDGNSLSSGMYFYKMQAGTEFSDVKKMILVK